VNRIILAIAVAFAIIAPGTKAFAQPSPADIDKAKKEFMAGKKAFDGGDFPEAASHFKTSYNLSKKPTLLYNVALANESGGQDDIALFYYRKFLTDADPADAQRADAEMRVKALEKKFGTGNTPTTGTPTTGTPTTGGNTTTTTTPPPEQHKEPTKLKPPGTYQPTEFQHQIVDAAPPKKALDVTAFVPEDSGWKVTLYFRTAGEGKFQSKEMRWRYKELVARIPPTKMIGESVQYYIEVKDPASADAVVVRSGKATSPNLVELQVGAAERFYPDWNDETGATQSAAEVKRVDEDEDPLNRNKKKKVIAQRDPDGVELPPTPERPGQGFGDVGSQKFKGMKWASTGVAVAGIGLSVVFFIQAGKQSDAIVEDSTACGAPPCRAFNSPTDKYDVDVQAAGKRYDTLSTVSLVFGIAGAGVAGYYWYKELKAKKGGEQKVTGARKSAPSPESSWIITPSAGDGFAGAAAAGRF
jgi:hypothetical protein